MSPINFSQVLISADGVTPLMESADSKVPLTLRVVCLKALLLPSHREANSIVSAPTLEEKLARHLLATRILNYNVDQGLTLELTPVDVIRALNLITDAFPPSVVGQCYAWMNI